jgi:hypothetical protein
MTIPPPNIVLKGNLLKKVPDFNSAVWNGLALQTPDRQIVRKCEKRWKESEESKRTIYPEAETRKTLLSSTQKSYSNLTEMINRGYSKDYLGSLNKRVAVGGKHLNVNAMSYENTNASSSIFEAYKELHPVNIATIERRQKKPSQTGELKNSSTLFQSSLLSSQSSRPIKIKPDFISSISDLPGSLKQNESSIDYSNPKVKFLRNTATSLEKGEHLGEPKPRNGPRQEIIPNSVSQNWSYNEIGQESQLNPYSRGKAKNCQAEDKLLRGTVEESDLITSRKGRPASARNMFTSSFTFS